MTRGKHTVDRLALRGIRGFGRHGVFDVERADGQEFVVDVVLGVDTRVAGETDDLGETVDYGLLAKGVKATIESDPVNLVETLAQRIADLCLDQPVVRWAEVTVHKPDAPVDVALDDVAITIYRSRT
jgi:7,8-dihydroneopterin aldolase/epimerase/oxygenase